MSLTSWLKDGLTRGVDPAGRPKPSYQPSLVTGVTDRLTKDIGISTENMADVTDGPRFVKTNTKRQHIFQAFDAGMPVENRTGLSGRQTELNILREGIIDQHKHGILFGPRGSGKTSLARVLGDIADEAHHIVLYNSASGDMSFPEIMRPFIEELASSFQGVLKDERARRLLTEPFNARDIAILFAEEIPSQTLLILDEFDRVASPAAKHEIAAMMKLLSDTRSSVRLLIVGIAINLEDLVEGHPSLRRHLVSLPIGPIASPALRSLLINCCEQAGIGIEERAAELLVGCAAGSPYHLRFFGMHAALAAQGAGEATINIARVKQGLSQALFEWTRINPPAAKMLDSIQNSGQNHSVAIITACVLGAYKVRFDQAGVATALASMFKMNATDAQINAKAAVDSLSSLLLSSGVDNQLMFQDSLLPQFFMLKLQQIAGTPPEADETLSTDAEARENLRLRFNQ
jgi:hypothetical protein